MEQTTKNTPSTTLQGTIAEERIYQGLRNIDHNLSELTQKLRKPQQQVQYVATHWRQWRKNALICAGVVAGLVITRKILK